MYNLGLPLITFIFFLSSIRRSTMLTLSLKASVIERMLPVDFPKPISIKDFVKSPVLQYHVGSFEIFEVVTSILIVVYASYPIFTGSVTPKSITFNILQPRALHLTFPRAYLKYQIN